MRSYRETSSFGLNWSSAGEGQSDFSHSGGLPRHPFAHRAQISGTRCDLVVEALPQHLLKKCFRERWRQFDARLAVTAPATIKPKSRSDAARRRGIAVHQDGQFVIGQPDLRHGGLPSVAKDCRRKFRLFV
jgi:hypothetical protein